MDRGEAIALVEKVGEWRYVAAVRRGLLLNMPIVIVGSFAVMINNLPLPWYQAAMLQVFGPQWTLLGQAIWQGSFGIMSLLLVLSVSYFLAESHELVKSGILHPAMVSLVSLSCLVIIMEPFAFNGFNGLPFGWLGTGGLFLAIVTALLSAELVLWLCSTKKININMFFEQAEPGVSQAMLCLVPVTLTLAFFAFIKFGAAVLLLPDIHGYLYHSIANLFLNMQNTLATAVIFEVLIHFFWFFGMHGNNILVPVEESLYKTAAEHIFTKPFFDSFVLLGGSGATLCLILALLVQSRRGNMLRLARISLVPGIFNINELLVFGLPIVLNPIYFLPFLLVPVLLTLVSYCFVSLGLVPLTVNNIHWTTPPLLSGYLATESWKGVFLQVFNILLGTAVYMPFVKFAEKQKSRSVAQVFERLLEQVESPDTAFQKKLLVRRDSQGHLARRLAADLKEALRQGELTVEYQPQVNYENQVIGVEALLRWSHPIYGRIPPALIIVIAEEAGLIHTLGKWIFETAFRQLRAWETEGIANIRMSVNVSVMQLYSEKMVRDLSAAIADNGVTASCVEVEITEGIALLYDTRTLNTLNKLHETGVRIAIDDFGMGHSSLLHIKHFPVHTIKIDRALSREVVSDKSCQEIISSINTLCASLNIEVIVEYVETELQRDKLKELGSTQYQGYLYSPAVPAREAAQYIQNLQRAP